MDLAIPMVVGARVIGVIEVHVPSEETLDEDALEILETLASHAGAALEAARLHAYTEELSQVDPLTRLLNRRRLEVDLEAEFSRSWRYSRPLTFVMLDVDHFKKLNDTLGHQVGDEVLQELGDLLSGALQTSDTAYRYDGEEFAVLLRETDQDSALTLTERLRSAVETHFSAPGAPARITASFGVAEVAPGDPSPAALVKAADEALYESKKNGRNRVSARA